MNVGLCLSILRQEKMTPLCLFRTRCLSFASSGQNGSFVSLGQHVSLSSPLDKMSLLCQLRTRCLSFVSIGVRTICLSFVSLGQDVSPWSPQGQFLRTCRWFLTDHSVAHYIRSLAPITPLIYSKSLSFNKLTHSLMGWMKFTYVFTL